MGDWHSLYGEGWTNEIIPDAFSHPAKFARGLIRRIYEHAIEEGWLVEGDTVVDPFAGVALGAADALAFGLNWIGNELEQRFVDMGRGCECTGISKEDWVRCFGRWDRFRYEDGRHWCPRCVAEAGRVTEDWEPALPGMEERIASYRRNSGKIQCTEPHHYTGNLELFTKFSRNGARAVLLQGDSRNLVDVLDGARAVISSPPYVQATAHPSIGSVNKDDWGHDGRDIAARRGLSGEYSTNPANLGNMCEGDHEAAVKAVVGSPPYAGNRFDGGEESLKRKEGFSLGYSKDGGYAANSPGQLAAMPEGSHAKAIVSSPPWMYSHAGHETEDYFDSIGGVGHKGLDYCDESPKESTTGGDRTSPQARKARKQRAESVKNLSHIVVAGNNGNLVNIDTFWSAAKTIVEQCYQVLAPRGVAIWVVKDFVRNGQRVDFTGQWRELCESCGFVTLHEHRCWLVEDRGGQYALNGDLVEKVVERKSFFRRLAEKKGSPRIDWEVVLCMRKGEGI